MQLQKIKDKQWTNPLNQISALVLTLYSTLDHHQINFSTVDDKSLTNPTEFL